MTDKGQPIGLKAVAALQLAQLLISGGGCEGPRGYPCGGEMGSHGPPQAPIFFVFFFFLRKFSLVFMGTRRYLRPCYHALRQPVGAADRAMLHN